MFYDALTLTCISFKVSNPFVATALYQGGTNHGVKLFKHESHCKVIVT